MQSTLWPFYKQLPSLTRLLSSTIRNIKRITLSYPLAITWWTPLLNRQSQKCLHTPAILPIHYSYTEKETEVLKTQGTSQHQSYWFLNNILVLLE
jgi:hypothetical protein